MKQSYYFYYVTEKFIRLFKFDYCESCKQLFQKNDTECKICHTTRFKENSSSGPIEKKMKSFFLMRDLKEIQKCLYKGMFSL